MKKIIAILLVLVIAIGCTACKTTEEFIEENVPSVGSYVDSEGNVHDVYIDKDGNNYYLDENGEKKPVSEDEVIPPPEYIEPGDDKLEMTDDLVGDETIADSTSDSAAKTEADNRMKTYFNIIKSNQYTISGTMMQMDGSVTKFPLLYVRNNNDFYIEAQVPMEDGKSMKASIVYLNGKTYCAIPSMKVFYTMDTAEGVGDDFGTGTFSDEVISKFVFVESGTVTLNGKQYICDVYNMEGETHKYYYDTNNSLVRIEEIYSEKKYTILEIDSMSAKPDTSKIKKPTGIDITGMM